MEKIQKNKMVEKIRTHMLDAFFWLIPRRLNFICQRFGTLFRLHRRVEQTECSETSAYKILAPGDCPEESIQYSEHGESLKSHMFCSIFFFFRKSCRLWDNVEKYCRAGEATDENMVGAPFVLDT